MLKSNFDKEKIVGLVLAGGTSERFGGNDKAWIFIDGKALIEHQVEWLIKQSSVVKSAINCNRNFQDYKRLELPLIIDDEYANFGPLSGIFSGLKWAKSQEADWLFVLPVDTWCISNALIDELVNGAKNEDMLDVVMPVLGGRAQHATGLWSIKLLPDLREQLAEGGGAILHFLKTKTVVKVDCSVNCYSDNAKALITNINSPEDIPN